MPGLKKALFGRSKVQPPSCKRKDNDGKTSAAPALPPGSPKRPSKKSKTFVTTSAQWHALIDRVNEERELQLDARQQAEQVKRELRARITAQRQAKKDVRAAKKSTRVQQIKADLKAGGRADGAADGRGTKKEDGRGAKKSDHASGPTARNRRVTFQV